MEKIVIEVTIETSPAKAWTYWTGIEHISGWAFASAEWGAEGITNDVQKGGAFSSRMFAKDGSFEFIFSGKYNEVIENQLLDYTLDDGRNVTVEFVESQNGVTITQTFEPETENPTELQREGWQAFLNNFKQYVENN